MTEVDVEQIVQHCPREVPRRAACWTISDNRTTDSLPGISRSSIRVCGMTHVRTSPYYPQSNSKIERWHPGPSGGLPASGYTLVAGGRTTPGSPLRRALQWRPPALGHRLRHPQRQTRRPRKVDALPNATANWSRPRKEEGETPRRSPGRRWPTRQRIRELNVRRRL